MDEEFVLDIDDLSMRDPSHYLIDEHFLAFSKHYCDPFLEPLISLLIHLPQNIDYYPSSVLLCSYSQHDLPDFFEDELVFASLSTDVAKCKVSVFEEITFNGQDEVFVLLYCLSESLRHSFTINTRILLEVSIRGLCELVIDELDDLGIVVAHLRNFVDEVGLRWR